MKIIETHAVTPLDTNQPTAVIQFDNGYYWEIPATRNDAVKIAELAEDLAGQQLDGIVFFGEYAELAFRINEPGKSVATSFGAAFQAAKLCRGSDD